MDDAARTPPELGVDDHLVIATVIRAGDIVCFERVEPHLVALRALAPSEQRTYAGAMYQVQRGDEAGRMTFNRVAVTPKDDNTDR